MSYDESRLNRTERELEAMLGTLKPQAPAFSGEEIAFEAGRRAGRMQLRRWRAAAAILVGALGVSLLARPQPTAVEKVVYIQPAAQTSPRVTLDERPYAVASPRRDAYLNLRRDIVERGIDALTDPHPASDPTTARILRAGSTLDELRG